MPATEGETGSISMTALYAAWYVTAVVVATVTSRVIYGLQREVERQAEFIAYLQDFRLLTILILLLLPLVFLMRGRPKDD